MEKPLGTGGFASVLTRWRAAFAFTSIPEELRAHFAQRASASCTRATAWRRSALFCWHRRSGRRAPGPGRASTNLQKIWLSGVFP